MMITCWQKRRSTFNHDWLKNQYMPALAKYLNLLDDLIEDGEFAQTFVSHVLPEWERQREEAMQIIKTFEREMSPQRLLDSAPLCRCKDYTKRWLGNLMHLLWLERYPVRSWIAEASESLENTDAAYERLQEALRNCDEVCYNAPPKSLRTWFADFRDKCQLMANAISKFPSEVNVV